VERLLTARQIAELLGMKTSTIYYWVHIGFIPCHHTGRSVRFKESEVEEWWEKVAEHSEGRASRQPTVVLDNVGGNS
jgi:excisionase family DNA binding protein